MSRRHDLRSAWPQVLDRFRGQVFDLCGASLVTEEVIHSYPGKRVLVTGMFGNRSVVAKFYLGRVRGWWEWYRGRRGTRAMLDAGVLTPSLRYSGYHRPTGAWITLLDRVQADQPWPPTVEQLSEQTHQRMLETLADHHRRGIVQNDLGWGNFLPEGQRFHSIDGDRIRRYPAPLSTRRILDNLARFYGNKPAFTDRHVRWGYTQYCRASGRLANSKERELLVEKMQRLRRDTAQRVARRALRGWKYFRLQRSASCRFLSDRRAVADAFHQALESPAAASRQARQAPVGLLYAPIAGAELRILLCGVGASGSARRSTPSRTWVKTTVARRLGIPVENPVVVVECARALFWRDGYILLEPRAQRRLGEALLTLPRSKYEPIVQQLGAILGRMKSARVTHAALDIDAFGWDGRQVVLLDLPSLCLPPFWAPGFQGRWERCIATLTDDLVRQLQLSREQVQAQLALVEY